MLRIKELRHARGLSQERLAARAEVATKTVRRAETGGSVSSRTLTKLARALGVAPGELFSRADREAS